MIIQLLHSHEIVIEAFHNIEKGNWELVYFAILMWPVWFIYETARFIISQWPVYYETAIIKWSH